MRGTRALEMEMDGTMMHNTHDVSGIIGSVSMVRIYKCHLASVTQTKIVDFSNNSAIIK